MEKIRLGISACLLGKKVRYDGRDKLDPFLKDTLGKYIDFFPVCPEVELGMGVPREPLRLVGDPDNPRLVTAHTGRDITVLMASWSRKQVKALEKETLSGFIFKSRSPSSGMERVKIYNEKGAPAGRGVGLFARIFREHFPLLPVEDEERLRNPSLRENFFERLFALQRWREHLSEGRSITRLTGFHNAHRLSVLSHSQKHDRLLKDLLATKGVNPDKLYSRYQLLFLETIRLRTTVRKHVHVLRFAVDNLTRQLSGDEIHDLLESIEAYRRGLAPLIVPVTLIGHCARKFCQTYLEDQVYLNPDPLELHLRYHA
jgi:uncharacterized protein YbbK (DUF523 family)/uncharacterized protein YbgA (DUF1722 family)